MHYSSLVTLVTIREERGRGLRIPVIARQHPRAGQAVRIAHHDEREGEGFLRCRQAASATCKSSREGPSASVFIIVWKSSELYRAAGFLFMARGRIVIPSGEVSLSLSLSPGLAPSARARICPRLRNPRARYDRAARSSLIATYQRRDTKESWAHIANDRV